MPQVRLSDAAVHDLARLQAFLRHKSPSAARRAAAAIINGVQSLDKQPRMGRPVAGLPHEFREWIIDFGASGYIARYYYDGGEFLDILAIRHAREAGFINA